MNAQLSKRQLLKWCNGRIKPYDLIVVDFGYSWRTAMPFCALLHSHPDGPNWIDYDSLDENKRYVIPNSIISEETIENFNLKEEKTCQHIEIGISYDADIDKAMEIMRRESESHPSCIDPRTPEEKEAGDPIVPVRVVSFGDSSVNLKAWVWADHPATAFRMGCDLRKRRRIPSPASCRTPVP